MSQYTGMTTFSKEGSGKEEEKLDQGKYIAISIQSLFYTILYPPIVVSAHRRILGMASVVCVLVKICASSISLYKLDTDELTTPFESAHQFTLVCTVSDSKTVPGCHYNLYSNHSFVLTD